MALDDIPDMHIHGFDPADPNWNSKFVVLDIMDDDCASRKIVYAGNIDYHVDLVRAFFDKYVKNVVPDAWCSKWDGRIGGVGKNDIITHGGGRIAVSPGDDGKIRVRLYDSSGSFGRFDPDVVKPIVDAFVAKYLPGAKVDIV